MTQFTGRLPKTILKGDKILLEGYFDEDAESFSLNLVCDHNDSEEEPSEVVYNYELKFDAEGASMASFNYKHNGVWQNPTNEEDLQIIKGEKFELLLLMRCSSNGDSEDVCICTYYNGMSYATFDVKLPIENAKYIEIWSGLRKMESIKFVFS